MSLLVFVVRSDLSVEAFVRMMVDGLAFVGSAGRGEELQAV